MRFVRSSSTTLIFKMIAMICGFGVSILIGRVLGPEGRGVYGLVMTIIVLSSSFGLFGFSGANAYLISRDLNRAKALGVQSLFVGALGFIITAAIIYIINTNWPSILGGLNKPLFWITLSLVPMYLWGYLFSNAYLGCGKIVAYMMFETGQRVIFLLAALVLLSLMHRGMNTYMTVVSLTIGAMVLGYILWFFRSIKKGPSFDLKLIPDSFAYGVRSYVATVVTFAVMRSGIFFVNYFCGTAQAGMFSVAQQMAELLVIVPSVIGTVLFSRIASGDSKELTAKVTRTATVIFLPLFVFLALIRNVLVTLLFGAEFLPAAEVFLILLPGTFFLGLEVLIASDIAGRGYPWPAALAWIPILIMNVVGYSLLVPRFGINGAAFSSTVSFIAIFAFILWYYRRISGQKLRTMFIVDKNDLKKILSIPKEIIPSRLLVLRKKRNYVQTVLHKDKAEIESISA
jgi:O-antigen/teichoic acid export membrane protein